MNPELQITPAKGEPAQWVKNCIVIPEGFVPAVEEITRTAIQNEAWEDNSDDEAGDDEYCVQFPGRSQELLTSDGLRGRIRELLRA